MEFEEVSQFIKHGHVPDSSISTTSLDLRYPRPPHQHTPQLHHFNNHSNSHSSQQQQQQQRFIDALAIGHPYANLQPPRKLLQRSSLRRRPLTAKLVDSVRRFKRSTLPKDALSSDDEPLYREQLRHQQPPRARLLHRLRRPPTSITTPLSEDAVSGGYLSMDDAYPTTKRHNKRRKKQQLRLFTRPKRRDPVNVDDPDSGHIPSPDLHQIHAQMLNFRVPATWAYLDTTEQDHQLAHIDENITLARVMEGLSEEIQRYHYLLQLEEQRIEVSRSDIKDLLGKLQTLDQDVQQLNSRIDLARMEGQKRMEYTLAKVQRRLPVLKETRARHKRTVMSIESYSKSMDYASRMADLEHKVLAARKRQAAWDYVQRWVLPAVFLLVSGLTSLFVTYLRG